MDSVMFCPQCGHVLIGNSHECPVCGKAITDPPRFEELSFEEAVEGSFVRLEKVAMKGYGKRLDAALDRLEALEGELEQIIELDRPLYRQ
jgi:hypothetical protein